VWVVVVVVVVVVLVVVVVVVVLVVNVVLWCGIASLACSDDCGGGGSSSVVLVSDQKVNGPVGATCRGEKRASRDHTCWKDIATQVLVWKDIMSHVLAWEGIITDCQTLLKGGFDRCSLQLDRTRVEHGRFRVHLAHVGDGVLEELNVIGRRTVLVQVHSASEREHACSDDCLRSDATLYAIEHVRGDVCQRSATSSVDSLHASEHACGDVCQRSIAAFVDSLPAIELLRGDVRSSLIGVERASDVLTKMHP
jgi:hypothetical protein